MKILKERKNIEVFTLKRYAVCGVSNRAIGMFIRPIIQDYHADNEVVALLDVDARRFEIAKQRHEELVDLPEYFPNEFDKMIEETNPDVVIGASRDDTHVDYILQALKHNLDVIVEKPMATTAEDSKKIMDAEASSDGKVTVTFNYRYSPIHTKIKEMILEGKVGKVTSIDLNWYIDTFHGSSYFKRWNRMREFSGGLSIHKSSHHFDLVNWWTGQTPVEAFAFGGLFYYGENGPLNPEKVDGRHCGTCPVRQDCSMKTYDNTEAPQTGWGQFIKDYFTKDVPIFNYALGGRSTRTFMEEGHLDKVFGEIKESDYLFVQMGHNDSSKNKPERYTEPNTTYKKNLKIYIKGTIERNAKSILITPVARLKYKNEQFITDLTEYCIAMKEVAQEESIPLIDLNTKSLHYYSSLG